MDYYWYNFSIPLMAQFVANASNPHNKLKYPHRDNTVNYTTQEK